MERGVYLSYESFKKLIDEKARELAFDLSKAYRKNTLKELLALLNACETKSKDELKIIAGRAKHYYEQELEILNK